MQVKDVNETAVAFNFLTLKLKKLQVRNKRPQQTPAKQA